MSTHLPSGYSIPSIGLGVYLTLPNQAPHVVQTALETGYRHVDSARAYRNERSTCEGILQYLAKHPHVNRTDVYYTTKIGDADHGYEQTKKAIAQSINRLSGESLNESGKTLEYIDLMLIHSPQSTREKRLGTWKALQEAVKAGLIKSIGVSNYGIPHLNELLTWPGLEIPPSVNQVELHPWLQRKELVLFCRQHQIILEAYSPLTRGQRLSDPQLELYSKKYKKTPAQILVKWSLQAGFVTLPKSVHDDRIRENFNVNDFELSKEDFENLGNPNEYGVTGWDPTTHPL